MVVTAPVPVVRTWAGPEVKSEAGTTVVMMTHQVQKEGQKCTTKANGSPQRATQEDRRLPLD